MQPSTLQVVMPKVYANVLTYASTSSIILGMTQTLSALTAPLTCDGCGHQTYGPAALGTVCEMPTPEFDNCPGMFRAS